MTPLDANPPLAPVPSMTMQKTTYEWPGPGPRIASLLPPEHLGTPLAGQLSLTDDMGYTQVGAYPYAQQNFWIGGTDQSAEVNFGMADEKVMNPEMMRRRHVWSVSETLSQSYADSSPVCDKRFNRPSSLSTHMAVHTGAKRESHHLSGIMTDNQLSFVRFKIAVDDSRSVAISDDTKR